MTDFDNTIIGPRFEMCGECSGRNTDGYDDIIHKAGCSQAPSGKRAKMQPVEVSIDDLPPELRAALRDQPSSAEPAPPTNHVETWQTSEGRSVTVLPSFHAGKQLTVVMFPNDGAALADKALAESEKGPVTLIGATPLLFHQLRLRVAEDPSLAEKIEVLYKTEDGYRRVGLRETEFVGPDGWWPPGFDMEAWTLELQIRTVVWNREHSDDPRPPIT